MINYDITKEELEIIQKRREEELKKLRRLEFQRRSISVAGEFIRWSDLNNEGLTYSTFINNFGYQENDGRAMYEAVARILEASYPT